MPGAAGTWKDLTENVNQLAANLTTQVRAIAEVATAVTKGDLTRSITVEAQGEVAALKDTINEMIRNLQGHHAEEHRAGLAEDEPGQVQPHAPGAARPDQRRPHDALRTVPGGHRPAGRVLRARSRATTSRSSNCLASYAHQTARTPGKRIRLGEGLVGQCALEKQKILLDQRADRLHPHLVRAWAKRRRQHPRAAADLRRPGQRRAGTGLLRAASTRRTRPSSIS